MLDHSKAVDRLLENYSSATSDQIAAGRSWYLNALAQAEAIASETGHSVPTVVATIAHLSPRMFWHKNVEFAHKLLKDGHLTSGVMQRSLNGAKRAISSSDPLSTLSGPKTTAFAHNLMGDHSKVTIDVWAVRAALGDDDSFDLRKKGAYEAMANVYSEAATKLNLKPAELQAIAWVVERGRAT